MLDSLTPLKDDSLALNSRTEETPLITSSRSHTWSKLDGFGSVQKDQACATAARTPATIALTPCSDDDSPKLPSRSDSFVGPISNSVPQVVDTSYSGSDGVDDDSSQHGKSSRSARALFTDNEPKEKSREELYSNWVNRRSEQLPPTAEPEWKQCRRSTEDRAQSEKFIHRTRKLRTRHSYGKFVDGSSNDSSEVLSDRRRSDIPKTLHISSIEGHLSSDGGSRRSSRKRGSHRRRSGEAGISNPWLKLFVRVANHRGMVWLLCAAGFVSLSLTVITNRSIALGGDDRDPPDVFLYRKSITPPLALGLNDPPAGGLRGKLLHFSGAQYKKEAAAKKVVEAKDDPHRKEKEVKHKEEKKDAHHTSHHDSKHVDEKHRKDKHHDDKKHHHDDKKHREDKKHHDDKKHHEDKHKDSHHHHHRVSDEAKDKVTVAAPKSAAEDNPSLIQPIALPKSLNMQPKFDNQDRKLYTKDSDMRTKDVLRRVVFLGDHGAHSITKYRKVQNYPADFTDNTQLYSVLDSSDERVRKFMERREPLDNGECVPMQEWQTTFHPSCNGVHELGLAEIGDKQLDADFKLFGTQGYWRNAWKVHHSTSDVQDTLVLKTLKIEHRFEEKHYEHDRIDAVAMERLTSSPHVINIFGFCGHSVMTEYADGKRLGELADKVKKKPLARLRIARDIATGLADVHGIDGDGNATFVHLDINPANVVSIGGTLKLNDFNIGIVRRWNTTSNSPCGFPAQYPNAQWRSPEEARNDQNLTEKVDVYSLGHIFFRLIFGHEPWNKLEPHGKPDKDELTERVIRGELPTMTEEILRSTDPEVVAIREAMMKCYTYNPEERPSARSIASFLKERLDQLEQSPIKTQ